ncbi:MAG TPA: CAP domain-containing protein, partial [Pyrinomonadaceae bacterium]|nr:CAP domain-containing protein [Pyrinomonadaceae bacterium]
MKRKVLIFVFGCLLIFSLAQASAAQKTCDGKQLFTEKNCAGDTLDTREKELFRLINEYRAQNRLPALVLSDALSVVANRHLLDLNINLRQLTHGWSNCPYDIKNESTWKCILNAPRMLGVKYDGNGYENLYRNHGSAATPP